MRGLLPQRPARVSVTPPVPRAYNRHPGGPPMLRALTALACLVPMTGCLIVVDRDHGSSTTYVTSDDTYHRGRIGVFLDSVEPSTVSQLGLQPGKNTLVTGVVNDSSAAKAGLQRHDIITAIDGDDNASPSRVREAIRGHKSGEDVSMTVLRQGKPLTIAIPVN